jgi:hypothetical protein
MSLNRTVRIRTSGTCVGGITEFKKGYHPITKLVKDERGDLLADPHKIVNRWMNYFCQLLDVQGAVGVRQTDIQTAEPFVPEPSILEVEVTTGKLKSLQVWITFQHNWFKQGGEDIALCGT